MTKFESLLSRNDLQRRSVASSILSLTGSSHLDCGARCGDSLRKTSCCSQRSLATTPCGQGGATLFPGGKKRQGYVGILDVFKIGVGPSSSHTMGPMEACYSFSKTLVELVGEVQTAETLTVNIELFGSLALTGKGHATDKASVLGLAGFRPSTIDPDFGDAAYIEVCATNRLDLAGKIRIHFDPIRNVQFHYSIELPYHPNGMTVTAIQDDIVILTETYYSIGGGFILTEAEIIQASNSFPAVDEEDVLDNDSISPSTAASEPDGHEPGLPYPFDTAEALVSCAEKAKISVGELMIRNECVFRKISREEVFSKIDELTDAIDKCVDRGMRVEGLMPVSRIPRRACQIRRRLEAVKSPAVFDSFGAADWIGLFARAVNEENACGGRVVTAPTNGAAGTVPAVLTYYRRYFKDVTEVDTRLFIATAAAIGSLCKRNASISGAEAGCQAEVGSACAMASAALCAVTGGTPRQVENAAEIGLEHCLGMTCDPIMGLVQIPCIERNCIAAVKAVTASRLALLADGEHEVSLDSCIETMYRTGLDMQTKYRETSLGGLALFAKKMHLDKPVF